MHVFHEIAPLRAHLAAHPRTQRGFVPTMGALHAGHRALMKRARAECAEVALSIYVNRPQFNDAGDFSNYPVTLEADLEMARAAGVDVVFAPPPEALYPDAYRYRVTETAYARTQEGAHRPGHFDGVLTVVLKLFQLIDPGRAYFGEKDWQQLRLVEGMVEALFLPVEIVRCPTVRAEDGLALSSRNARLSPEDRMHAAAFPAEMARADSAEAAAEALRAEGFEVEYIVDDGDRRLGAVILGGVRLIDNLPLPPSSLSSSPSSFSASR